MGMISYNMDEDLAPLLCIQSIQSLKYRGGNNITFLWERIERQMIDHVLLGKPLIQSKIRSFQFANEMQSSVLQVLRKNIPQEEIIILYQEKILFELGTLQNIRQLRDDVDVCVGFLSATSKSFQRLDWKIKIVDYMRDTLLLPPSVIQSYGSTVSQIVQLRHIFSLRQLLNDRLLSDTFEQVKGKYKKELSQEQKVKLLKMKNNFAPSDLAVLLSTWKEFILHRLCGEFDFDENGTLKSFLGYEKISDGCTSLEELPWFNA